VIAARVAALVCAALVPVTQMRLDRSLGRHRAAEEILYLWSGDDVRKLFPGFELLMADVYWIRTVQYFGGQRAFGKEKKFEVLEPLIDITVTLDPRFEIAYRYGATFLSEPWPVGAGRPEQGVKVLERGARANPRSWFIQQNLGFFTYYYLGDAQRAARSLLQAARLPGAPSWLETLAADVLGRSGDRATARTLWRRMYEQAEEGPLRQNALRHLEYLEAEERIEALLARVNAFQRKSGRNPESLAELGLGVPSDPAGVPFAYDSQSGTVSLSPQSRLWRPVDKPRPRS
jgi:hypothetical protein